MRAILRASMERTMEEATPFPPEPEGLAPAEGSGNAPAAEVPPVDERQIKFDFNFN